ncbi:MAG: IMP dehydrogenase [Candidatus Portiera sp.]|nr:IMP dehydrogenase [Portiera sp.]
MLRIEEDAFTFDDLLLLPRYSEVIPSEVSTETRLTKRIGLGIPLLSAAMDTVTESAMAIALAKMGGIGVIHRNNAIDKQVAEVIRVKKNEGVVVRNPITIYSDGTVEELRNLTERHQISGVPVIDRDSNKLAGIVTSRDFRLVKESNKKIKDIMTPRDKLITAAENIVASKALELMNTNRIEKILLVKNGDLRGLMTLKDIEYDKRYPLTNKDEHGRLRVAASIGTDVHYLERSTALIEAGADLLVMDTAHGHSRKVINAVKACRKKFPNIGIIAGNIATGDAALALAKAGADAIKVGIGPGTICTTRMISGVGVPQLSAIASAATALKKKYPHVSVIADGGIRYSGDITKAIAAGADSVMIGSLLAGTEEAPGEVVLWQGRSYKTYRGMGSLGAFKDGSKDRYFQDDYEPEKLVPEGVEGIVPNRGAVSFIIEQLIGGLRSGMGYAGSPDLKTLKKDARFIRITAAGASESHVHDVHITGEAPNYRKEG